MNAIQCNNNLCKNSPGGNPTFFNPTRKHQKFCCPQCRMQAWRNRNSGDGRIKGLEKRIKKLEEKIELLVQHIDNLEANISNLEMDMQELESKFN